MSPLPALLHDGTLLAAAAAALHAASLAAAVMTSVFARCPQRRRDARQTLALLLPCRTHPPIPGSRRPSLLHSHPDLVGPHLLEADALASFLTRSSSGAFRGADMEGPGFGHTARIRITVAGGKITIIATGIVATE